MRCEACPFSLNVLSSKYKGTKNKVLCSACGSDSRHGFATAKDGTPSRECQKELLKLRDREAPYHKHWANGGSFDIPEGASNEGLSWFWRWQNRADRNRQEPVTPTKAIEVINQYSLNVRLEQTRYRVSQFGETLGFVFPCNENWKAELPDQPPITVSNSLAEALKTVAKRESKLANAEQ